MDGGWQKYLESIDKRLERLETVLGARIADVEKDVEALKDYKSQMMGRAAAVAFFMGIIVQVGVAYASSLFK